METGTVKFYDATKEWGYITKTGAQAGDKDIWFSKNALPPGTTLNGGENVEFELLPSNKGNGTKAGNIKIVSQA